MNSKNSQGVNILASEYSWDDASHLYVRDCPSNAYSEGDEVESRLLQLVSNAKDRGTFSDELNEAIIDWPSEYHFSRARHCLLRPLQIEPGAKVLELGCGCGAITRYLGEIGANVVAVEGSLNRARIAAERCRDLPNVTVVFDDALRFASPEQFDWVLLIGVLEYATSASTSGSSPEEYLRCASRFLAPHGALVVAIENKLGLKYFNGCAEDHLNIPYFGIQDLYLPMSPRTFSRKELREHLRSAGLPYTYFYYPFPDYKLPSVVLSEESLEDARFDPVDLLLRSPARDYSGSPYRAFDEALTNAVLHQNGTLAELSNSFLIIAKSADSTPVSSTALAYAFSWSRRAEFCIQTEFSRTSGQITVNKQYLLPKYNDRRFRVGNLRVKNTLTGAVYQPGKQILWKTLKARARGDGLAAIIASLLPWMEFLLSQSHLSGGSSSAESPSPGGLVSFHVRGQLLDCTPFNVLYHDCDLVVIDLEWQSESDIPLGWVVTRGVLHSLRAGGAISAAPESVLSVVHGLADSVGLSVSSSDVEAWLRLETEFQEQVTGRKCESWAPDSTFNAARSFLGEITSLRAKTVEQHSTIDELTRTVLQRDDRIGLLSNEVDTLQVQIQLLSSDAERLAAENRQSRELVREREDQLGRFDEELKTLRQRFAETEARLARKSQVLLDLRNDTKNWSNRLEGELRESLAMVERTSQELELYRKQVSVYQSSMLLRAANKVRHLSLRYTRTRRALVGAVRWLWWIVSLQLVGKLRERRRAIREQRIIAGSHLFDAQWYLAQYPDVALAGLDPAMHYAVFGAREPRNPSPLFDASWYLQQYRDIAEAQINPLVHYLSAGIREGREARPVQAQVSSGAVSGLHDGTYEDWIKYYDVIGEPDIAAIRQHIVGFQDRPLISVLMPVYNPSIDFLVKAIESVVAQLYPRWELCIADDASTDPMVREVLEGYAARDSRIKVVFRPVNGHISAATNSALEVAHGQFVALLDQDDELSIHALYMVALEINDHPQADIIYSDEDKIDADGRRYGPYFKTDWNQELFYSHNMVNHLGVFRASILRELGGLREGIEGSQDYDLVLRFLSHTSSHKIRHIPFVLYHWRLGEGVHTFSTDSNDKALASARRALADHFESKREVVEVVASPIPYWNRVIRKLPQPLPKVSLIVTAAHKLPDLRNCLKMLSQGTDYPNVELVVACHEDGLAAVDECLRDLFDDNGIRVSRVVAGALSPPLLRNKAAEAATGEILGFLEDYIEIVDPGWLREMVSQVVQSGVGAVGAKIYYRDDTVHHAGTVLGIKGRTGYGHRGHARSSPGHYGFLQLVRNVSSVSSACMLVSKAIFAEVGGFAGLKGQLNDIDLCLAIQQAAYSIVWTPFAEVYCSDWAPRSLGEEYTSTQDCNEDWEYLRRRWADRVTNDKFYNPNLSVEDEQFSLGFPPRVHRPWRDANRTLVRFEISQRSQVKAEPEPGSSGGSAWISRQQTLVIQRLQRELQAARRTP